jgi:hypothetical protein
MIRIAHTAMATALLALTAACSTNPTAPDSALSGYTPISSSASSMPRVASCNDPTAIASQTSANDVVAACGEPSFRDSWGMVSAIPQPNVIAPVEEWYYNPGPNGEIKVLRLVNGRVNGTTQDGAGFDTRQAALPCDASTLAPGVSKYRVISACGEPVSRDAYVVDPKAEAPGAVTFSKGNALIDGDVKNGKVAVYREQLAFNIDGGVKNVTVQNGHVLNVADQNAQVSSAY